MNIDVELAILAAHCALLGAGLAVCLFVVRWRGEKTLEIARKCPERIKRVDFIDSQDSSFIRIAVEGAKVGEVNLGSDNREEFFRLRAFAPSSAEFYILDPAAHDTPQRV